MSFLPTIEKMVYADYFYILLAGFPSQCVVKCTGRSTAPEISLSTQCLSFKYCEAGTEMKQHLTISNKSNVQTSFQIVLDSSESVFKVDKSCGVLQGNQELTINIRFCPLQPIPYYKRVPILLHRQDPVFLDLLGSGYTGDVRPGKLTAADLTHFAEKVRSGLSMYPPEVQTSVVDGDKGSLATGVPAQDLLPCLQYFTDPQVGVVSSYSKYYIFTYQNNSKS